MRLGIAILPSPPWDEVVSHVLTVDQGGFDILMTGDHMRHPTDPQMSPGPAQQPRPPIVVGANHRRMLRLAARRADTWNAWGRLRARCRGVLRPDS